ncbi:tyrosine-type recombinase/integrase [Nitrosopumilus ureiphilus]|uniref:tyrosine-type recombinase/integrase n=1 Tax=Nitrosopumilus ureiphilus TaxID=1470067 RepID=UPI0015CE302D|nr:site-specific integrase [Nitrosopumilus ureiphilus]
MTTQLTPQQVATEFLDSVYLISHSEKTRITYRTALNHFRKFSQSYYDTDEAQVVSKIKSEELDLYQVIRNFVIYLDKKNIKAQGLRTYLSGLKGYLRHWGIRINSDDYKQLIKVPKIVRTREVALTKEMILRILRNSSSKLQTTILISCSSGLRIGEITQLKLSDVDFDSKPVKINVRAEIAKGGSSRETFITTETANTLKDYLKKNFGWHEGKQNWDLQEIMIFGRLSLNNINSKAKNPAQSAKQGLQAGLRREIAKIPELSVRNENGRRAIHFHAFRKYFRTILGNVCGRDYAEALMGHGFYMDTYYQLPEEKKKQMYLDAEPQLTISDFETVEKNIKMLSAKNTQMEEKFNDLLQYLRTNKIEVPNL